MSTRCRGLAFVVLAAALPAGGQAARSADPPASIDLSQPFATRSAWRFTARQGPAVADPVGMADTVPGAIRLCISRDGGRTCAPDLDRLLDPPSSGADLYSRPHRLDEARIVWPSPGRPLLLLRVASIGAPNGDRRIATAALSYDRVLDVFVQSYARQVGHNNDQEVRYVAAGPLRGAIVSAEPTGDAPFAFRVTVERPGPDDRYRPVLRYRSATRYDDGNPLPVIDAEMPAIERRLGLWHDGMPMPLPAAGCSRPHLLHDALWCGGG